VLLALSHLPGSSQHKDNTPPAARAFICLKLPLSTFVWLAWRPKRAETQHHGTEGRPGRPQASALLDVWCKAAGLAPIAAAGDALPPTKGAPSICASLQQR